MSAELDTGRILRPKMARRTVRMIQRKKEKFLEAYARLGTASSAAEETGITTATHRRWLASSDTYRHQFELAEDTAIERLEKEALRRAVEGNEENVYFNGQVVGTNRRYSDVLLIFLLKSKRPDVYRERYDARIAGNLNIQSAVKVVHEYHDQPAAIQTIDVQLEPNKQLLTATLQADNAIDAAAEQQPDEASEPTE